MVTISLIPDKFLELLLGADIPSGVDLAYCTPRDRVEDLPGELDAVNETLNVFISAVCEITKVDLGDIERIRRRESDGPSLVTRMRLRYGISVFVVDL
jgi:hypothetical protein